MSSITLIIPSKSPLTPSMLSFPPGGIGATIKMVLGGDAMAKQPTLPNKVSRPRKSGDASSETGRASAPSPSLKAIDTTETTSELASAPRPVPLVPRFPVVGVGASAGGLEAFTALLSALPGNTGMAFVLIQHMDPNHQSVLTSLLQKSTVMPVREVIDGMAVQPNYVYVIPPNALMTISNGFLALTPRPSTPPGISRSTTSFIRWATT